MQPGEFLLSISVAALYPNAVRAMVTANLPSLPLSPLLPRCGNIDKGNGATGSDIFCPYCKLTNWYDNDESDLYESIDLINDYDDDMTDRLRRRILEASPHARIRHQVGIIEKVEQNQCLSCYRVLFHYQTYRAM